MQRAALLLIFIFLLSVSASAQNWIRNVLREGERARRNVGRTVEKGVRDITKTSAIAIHDIGKATGTAAENAREAIERGLKDASRESGRAGRNIVQETERIGSNTVDVLQAIKKFTETNITETLDLARATEERLREGKLLDAVFHAALDPLTIQEEAVYFATQQSGYLNTMAATAASAYGGPGGSAAYAAWKTYRASGGNGELAFRAGIIAGLSNSALKGIGTINGSEAKSMLGKAVLAGTVGGLAIAASGGDENQIKDGFILGGGMVLVQDLYHNYTGQPLDSSPASKDPYCMSTIDPSCKTLDAAYYEDENGKLVFDPSKLDRNASHVGVGADVDAPFKVGADIPWSSDQSAIMRSGAKVPAMNAMGLFHDKLVVSWLISENVGNQLTIFPAMLLTYIGTDGGLTAEIANVTAAQNAQSPSSNSVPTPNPASQPTTAGNTPSPVPTDLPIGFNGSRDKYIPLPPLEYARKYIDNQAWEDYGMKHMLTTKHVTAPWGSILYVRNIVNGALVRTYVIGNLSKAEIDSGATIILSDPAREQLGASGQQDLWVETDYEDIAVEKLTFKQGSGERLAFSNLRNGKWRLRVFDNFQTLYTHSDYDNQLQINLPPGQYGFDLVNTSPLQTYREYRGTFIVLP